jgi:hypothetical protein
VKQAPQLVHGSIFISMERIISVSAPSSSAAISAVFKNASQLLFFLPKDKPMILAILFLLTL